MGQSKLLVDTNSYIRLAQSIKPLLFVVFGENEYCLYIIPELNEELSNRRLNSKFPWVNEQEYKDNRKYFPKLSKKQKSSIELTLGYVWDSVLSEFPGPSKVDALYIAYAIELGLPVVTDDQDMTDLAKAYDVKVLPTLEVLKVMLDCYHINMKKIDSIVAYWRYIDDPPANLKKDYQRLFGKKLKL